MKNIEGFGVCYVFVYKADEKIERGEVHVDRLLLVVVVSGKKRNAKKSGPLLWDPPFFWDPLFV